MDKTKTFVFIGTIIFLGGLVPFAAQFLLPLLYKNANVAGAEVWNQYVSIVLGIVATILSVVSLKMCFLNDEQSRQTELKTQEILDKIDTKIQLLAQKQDQIYETISETKNNKLLLDHKDKQEWSLKQDDNIKETLN